MTNRYLKAVKNRIDIFRFKIYNRIVSKEVLTWAKVTDRMYLFFYKTFKPTFSIQEIDGKNHPTIDMSGIKFLGPSIGESFNCGPGQLNSIRRVLRNEIDGKTSNDQLALFHNILLRYHNELTCYPHYPIRTLGLEEGSSFVDVGAFRGYLSLKASKIVKEKGKVYTFEPIEDNFNLIKNQVDLNSIKNINLFNAAVSIKEEDHLVFYRTNSQVNSEIKDHLPGHKLNASSEIKVNNVFILDLWDQILKESISNIVFSITTNGTEIEIVNLLIEKILQSSKTVKIVIPVLYTNKQFIDHFNHRNSSSRIIFRKEFPWIIIEIKDK